MIRAVVDVNILAATRLSAADYLVTGDKKLLGLKVYAGTRIVSPREFIIILESQPTPSEN